MDCSEQNWKLLADFDRAADMYLVEDSRYLKHMGNQHLFKITEVQNSPKKISVQINQRRWVLLPDGRGIYFLAKYHLENKTYWLQYLIAGNVINKIFKRLPHAG